MLNMHRPSDQAKLLFFALLRSTVSALATDSRVAAARVVKNAPPLNNPALSNIQLRLARRADVASIQRCNLATLPENYNSQFYVNHLRQWPDLCLVAEDMCQEDDHNQYSNHHHDYHDHGFTSWGHSKPEPNIVAYVLGKVEEKPLPPPPYNAFDGRGDPYYNPNPNTNWDQRNEDRIQGHVTSLAVLQPYRRKGLAAEMMKQLHYHMEEAYAAPTVGLHVRKSNLAACRLYQEFGYEVETEIPCYYQDSENALYMKKRLQQPQGLMVRPGFTFLGRRPRAWEAGPLDLRLPRGLDDPSVAQSPELLSGSL